MKTNKQKIEGQLGNISDYIEELFMKMLIRFVIGTGILVLLGMSIDIIKSL